MPKIYKQTFLKSLPCAILTFSRIWSKVLGNVAYVSEHFPTCFLLFTLPTSDRRLMHGPKRTRPKGLVRLSNQWGFGYMNQRLQSPSTGRRPFSLQTSVSVIQKYHYHVESIEEGATRLAVWVNKSADRIWIYF